MRIRSQYGAHSPLVIAAPSVACERASSAGSRGVCATSGPNSGWLASRARSDVVISSWAAS